MARKKTTPEERSTLCFALRYNRDDYELVQRAAAAERMSINSWLVRLSLAAARRKLAKAQV